MFLKVEIAARFLAAISAPPKASSVIAIGGNDQNDRHHDQ